LLSILSANLPAFPLHTLSLIFLLHPYVVPLKLCYLSISISVIFLLSPSLPIPSSIFAVPIPSPSTHRTFYAFLVIPY